ncbi:N-alpha-acetyltransferase 30-like [Dysidea avara]|uniref:N-alpha-acetyltransferase 30-like n=1 Tax=Dysidea avara TaxID=196820 RepID=UPI00332A5079
MKCSLIIAHHVSGTSAHVNYEPLYTLSGMAGSHEAELALPVLQTPNETKSEVTEQLSEIEYVPYESELQLPEIMRLMKADLSEPYSVYTYRYFIHNWPKLCLMAKCDNQYVGAIVCKLDIHRYNSRRGYIAMLAVDKNYRKRRIGSTLVKEIIRQMIIEGCDEVVLEAEVTNSAALSLYENLGFVRDKYLHRYYLSGVDAYRLKLWLNDPVLEYC